MDSLSHIVIGASIGEIFLRKKNRTLRVCLGAIAKNAPDFDLFYTGLADPGAYMCEQGTYLSTFY
jgi:hypothetical protein